MRLRQACNHPLLVSSGLLCTSSSAEIARNLPYGSSKLKATLEILSDGLVQKGVKTLVFTQCTKMLDLLEDSLEESSFQYRRFDGKMSMESRHKSIEEFKNLPKEKKKKMVACAFGKCDQRFSVEDWEHLLVVD
ncbi:unnamed protein product [Brassica oleracea]